MDRQTDEWIDGCMHACPKCMTERKFRAAKWKGREGKEREKKRGWRGRKEE